jgi:hypothetical protein
MSTTLVLREGDLTFDGHGRVRVDVAGQYEDWMLPEDLPAELQAVVADAKWQSGATPPLPAPEPHSAKPAPAAEPSVSAAELAQALIAADQPRKPNGTGKPGPRELTPPEVEGLQREAAAKAALREAEARIMAARAAREEALTRQKEAEIEIILSPVTPAAVVPHQRPPVAAPAAQAAPATAPATDPVLAARAARQVAQEEYTALQYRLQHEALEAQVQQDQARQAAGSPYAPAGFGCLGFVVGEGLMTALMLAVGPGGYVLGPLILPVAIVVTVLAVRWAKRGQAEAARAVTAEERRAAYYAAHPQEVQ